MPILRRIVLIMLAKMFHKQKLNFQKQQQQNKLHPEMVI
jgi:hypothetical protein